MKKTKILVIIPLVIALLSACGKHVVQESKNVKLDESDPNIKKEIVVATIKKPYEIGSALDEVVSSFNSNNDYYRIVVRDYSQGGTYDEKDALTRLNTEIIGGNYPDMICFSSISPYPYIAKGIILDMEDMFANDDSICAEDIAIVKALRSCGGIYFISGGFTFETLIGNFSGFGERYGWSLNEYLEIEAHSDNSAQTIYNQTSESFLKQVASRYIRSAIDWETGTCDFDNSQFKEILEVSKRIKENPENKDNMIFGPGAVNVAEGNLTAALSWVTTVDKLANDEHEAGTKFSFIGWPTVDGSCGTDAYLLYPVGIVSQSQNIDACWEFIKYMVVYSERELELPMYMPNLKKLLLNAQAKEEGEFSITDNDAKRFLDLVSAIENIALYDTSVLDIIMKESGAYLNGDKTTEEVAKLIQSKVSIYLAEQS